MTSLSVLALIMSACGQAAPVATSTAGAGGERSATVGDLVGTVNGRASQAEVLGPVNVGFRLAGGGEVQTGEASKARLDFSDGAILRLAANSSFVLQTVAQADDGSLSAKIQLAFGKLWVSLFGGEVQVETPVGVAAVRGSFAVFSYTPGDPNDPNDDLLVVDCLEGACSASNATVNEALGNLERVVLGRTGSLRQELTSADVEQFLAENPESGRLVATLTAAPPETDTPTPSNTPVPTSTNTATAPTETAAPTETIVPVTPQPGVAILGVHVVQVGETLFCVGRGYGVLPGAIAAANNLDASAPLRLGEQLNIPAVQWTNITPGPVCAPQFRSPFPGLPTATAVALATFTRTVTQASATITATVTLSATLTLTPAATRTSTLTPTPTFTPTPTLTPIPAPSITRLSAFPASINTSICNFSFQVTITDPAGVASALVQWQVVDKGAAVVFGPNSQPMTNDGDWYASISGFDVPAGGSVLWTVTATNVLKVTASTAGPAIVDSLGRGCFAQ